MRTIGIVIVTYNSERQIGACLDALRSVDADILVVDNASHDNTCDVVRSRGVSLLANPQNRGFATAVNQGFQALSSPFVLLLNPDTELVGGLAEMRRVCAVENAGLACGSLTGEDGKPQIGFMIRRLPTVANLIMEALLLNRVLPGNAANGRYRCFDLDYDMAQPVEQPAGAFLMIRRSVWEALGGFDEGFFPLWFEDVDFCKRAIDHGYHPYYTPSAVAKHIGGHSICNIPVEMKAYYWYRSFLRYAAKHFRPSAVRVIGAAIVIGSILRMLVVTTARRSLKPLVIYGKVIGMAAGTFWSGGRCRVLAAAHGSVKE